MSSSSNRRPEEQAPADVFYNDVEANKYLHNSRMIEIQSKLAERSLEMLCLPEGEPSLLLDIGCGTGLSGEVLEEGGYEWIGCDISRDMLGVARRRELEGEMIFPNTLVHQDMGGGLPFRQGTFDGAISISAIQWLCYSDSCDQDPRMRLHRFFQSLYKCLRRGARAALQFYPQNADQLQLITASAMRAGFGGGLVIDFPHSSKAKKYFLVLLAGPPEEGFSMPTAIGEEAQGHQPRHLGPTAEAAERPCGARVESRVHARRKMSSREKKLKGRVQKKSRDWVLSKKEAQRKAGKEVCADSKYTARKRSKVRF